MQPPIGVVTCILLLLFALPRSAAAESPHVSARQTHWSLEPITRPSPPQISDNGWSQMPLDEFVWAELQQADISPSPAADRRTLVRRLSFDLLGLPPTSAAANAFVSDPRPNAFQRLVDRLLSSPHYGERWGRHWLDVARYADTRGYAFARDRRFPFAYTYRDYVIRALNNDLPFDRFVVEQLAADQLELGDDRWPLAALGFLTVGRRFNNVHDDIDDKIDVVTRGFLGLTVACARCHDHKYDAIPTEDYYSLYGIFASCHEPGDLPLIGMKEDIAQNEDYLAELGRRQQEFGAFVDERHAEVLEHARTRVADYLTRMATAGPEQLLDKLPFLSLGDDELRPKLVRRWSDYMKRWAQPDHPALMPWREFMNLGDDDFAEKAQTLIGSWQSLPEQRVNRLLLAELVAHPPQSKTDVAQCYGKLLTDTYSLWKEQGGNDRAVRQLPVESRQLALLLFDPATPTAIKRDDVKQYLSREHRGEYNALQRKIDEQQASAPASIPRAMVLRDNDRPRNAHVFIRGNHNRKGAEVPRRFLSIMASRRDEFSLPFAEGSGRLELARSITDPDNPLTARVIANRIWMHHFGKPLVSSPSDFGIRSEAPRQRRLLDYLAWRLMDSKWSLKSLHREILLSATYGQASDDRPVARAQDPENELLWRMNRRRLEYEPLRDALLFVAGKLDGAMGGKSVDTFTAPYPPRRSVYAVVDRQDLPNLLRAFDFASPDQSAARRSETTVPQQALFLMNSPFMLDLARGVAQRAVLAAEDVPQRVEWLYQTLFQREPTVGEFDVAERFLAAELQPRSAGAETDDNDDEHDDPLRSWQQLSQLLMLTNEFCFVD